MPEPSDPGLWWRAFSRVVSIAWVSAASMRLATVVDRPLMRLSGGRIRLSFVIPCLLLRCRGARTRRLYEVPLLYIADGEDVLLVGSGGGAEREPAWCSNLRAYPQVECLRRGFTQTLLATELSGTERLQAWKLAVAAYPGYQRYQSRVDRTIAVFRLRPTLEG